MLYTKQEMQTLVLLSNKLPPEISQMIVDKRKNEDRMKAQRKKQTQVKNVARLLCTERFQDSHTNAMSFGKMGGMQDDERDYYGGFVWADMVRIVSIDMAKIAIFPTRDRWRRRGAAETIGLAVLLDAGVRRGERLRVGGGGRDGLEGAAARGAGEGEREDGGREEAHSRVREGSSCQSWT